MSKTYTLHFTVDINVTVTNEQMIMAIDGNDDEEGDSEILSSIGWHYLADLPATDVFAPHNDNYKDVTITIKSHLAEVFEALPPIENVVLTELPIGNWHPGN